jgi:hypothetical protein
MGLFLVKEIRSKAGELHFRRWRFFDSPWFGIYLHYIAKADEDKHPHDHPWSFWGIILKGGYIEEFYSWVTWPQPQLNSNFAGMSFYRRASGEYHKINTVVRPTWTLVFHGPKKPTWGYMTEAGWMDNQTYREEKRKGRWDDKKEIKVSSEIVDFFEGVGVDGAGRFLEDILEEDFEWMESCHDYIQWLFPLREPSNFNPEAPLLTDEDVTYLRNAFAHRAPITLKFLQGADKFLAFLGIDWDWVFDSFNGYKLTEDFEQRKYTWMEFNHNALRITRFLSCLSILGFNTLATELLEFMKKTAAEQGVELNPRSLEYWEEALNTK